MLFNSFTFLLFFPVCLLGYFALPQRAKNPWLLVASYVFYMGWDARYALLLLFVTTVTYAGGLLVDRVQKNTPPPRMYPVNL